MNTITHRNLRAALAATGAALTLAGGAAAVSSAHGATRGATANRSLVGTFRLTAGRFAAGQGSGSYFRMILPTGGKYMANPDSTSSDKTYTLVKPGTSGGLVTGRFQPSPSSAFDSSGNSLARAIIQPQPFSGIRFGLATLPTDPQSHLKVPAPSLHLSGTKITGQLEAFTAAWNKQYFNQGSPKPGGSGASVTGTYDPKTHGFVLVWTSLIKGGPFDGFSGSWHLQGTFQPT